MDVLEMAGTKPVTDDKAFYDDLEIMKKELPPHAQYEGPLFHFLSS